MKTQSKIQPLSDHQINLDFEMKKYEIQEKIQNISERKKYAQWVFVFVASWLLNVALILIGCGYGLLHLSDTILSVLLTTTTIQICGFLVFVMKYLFGNKI